MEHEALNNVRRKISEVMKKTDDRILVGWTPTTEDRNEGDVWEDLDGRKWTIKNGIKQTVTKLDAAKTPLWCPECSKSLSHRLDTKFFNKKGKCWECVIKEETEIRLQGKWREYEESIMRANYIAYLKDMIVELKHLYENTTAPEIIHADDTRILMIEKWNVDIDKVKQDILSDIEHFKKELAKAEAGEPL
jgi:hypothetical protein